MKVKICGITNQKDAMWASGLGADYLGFNFYKESQRRASLDMAGKIISGLPSFVQAVGIFVRAEIKDILKVLKKCDLKLIQLHGDEPPGYCEELKENLKTKHPGMQIIKAFRINNEPAIEMISGYNVDYYLLDTYVPGMEGGTGEVFNWEFAVQIKKLGTPVFLAGGLTSENVKEAIDVVNPYCVDVASGVEISIRKKDYEKLKNFIYNAKGA